MRRTSIAVGVAGALCVILALAWSPQLVATIFNSGHPVSYHFAGVLNSYRLLFGILGVLFIVVGTWSWIYSAAVDLYVKNHRELFIGLGVLLVTIVILCVLGEIIARIFVGDETYEGGGIALRKQLEQIPRNSYGFRDIEYSEQKPANVTRILVLGDSFTFGHGVMNSSAIWPQLLEDELNQQGKRVEILNTGANGAQTPDELQTLNQTLWFAPDVVVLGYFLNDAETDTEQQKTGFFHNIYEGYDLFLFSHSYLYSFFKARIASLRINLGLEESYPEHMRKTYESGALTQHTAQLVALRDLAAAHGAKLIIIVIPGNYDFKNYPLKAGHDFMRKTCAEQNFTCIDLLERFSTEDYTKTRLNAYDAHPNEYGHRIIAETILNNSAFMAATKP